jgi:hypothetical protein
VADKDQVANRLPTGVQQAPHRRPTEPTGTTAEKRESDQRWQPAGRGPNFKAAGKI